MPDNVTQRLFWSSHSNPRSVWTAIATFPLLVLALYRRDRRLLAGLVGTVAVTSLFAPEPDDDSAWATRVVLGEQVWLDRGLASSPLDILLIVGGAPLILGTFRAALQRRPLRTAVGTTLSMALMGLFFHRMERLYEMRSDP